MIPGGIVYPQTTCIIGPGTVIDPDVLWSEINMLQDCGILGIEFRLKISGRAHVILPYHKDLDELHEKMKEHPVVLRYFHPTGTETLVCEIGADGEAFGYQVINGDWNASEFGYLNIDEIKNIPEMEIDYHFPENMSIERWLYTQSPEHFREYAIYLSSLHKKLLCRLLRRRRLPRLI